MFNNCPDGWACRDCERQPCIPRDGHLGNARAFRTSHEDSGFNHGSGARTLGHVSRMAALYMPLAQTPERALGVFRLLLVAPTTPLVGKFGP